MSFKWPPVIVHVLAWELEVMLGFLRITLWVVWNYPSVPKGLWNQKIHCSVQKCWSGLCSLTVIYLFIFKNIIPKYRFSRPPTHTQNTSYLLLFHATVVAQTYLCYIIHTLPVLFVYNIILCIAWCLSLLTCSLSPCVLICSWSTCISCA